MSHFGNCPPPSADSRLRITCVSERDELHLHCPLFREQPIRRCNRMSDFESVQRPTFAGCFRESRGHRVSVAVVASSDNPAWPDPRYMSRKNRKFRTDKFDTCNKNGNKTNGNFDSSNSCKRLGTSRLHESLESKFPFVTRIDLSVRNFIIFYHVSGVLVAAPSRGPPVG